jgi:pyruvate decarboxylase
VFAASKASVHPDPGRHGGKSCAFEVLDSRVTVPELPAGTPASDQTVSKLLEAIYAAQRPMIFVDRETQMLEAIEQVGQPGQKLGWPTWSSGYGKGDIEQNAA